MADSPSDISNALVEFLKNYNGVRWNRKKDVNSVVTDCVLGIALLEDALGCWATALTQCTDQLGGLEWRDPDRLTDTIVGLSPVGEQLTLVYHQVGTTIMMPRLAHDQAELTSGIGTLLDLVARLAELCLPDKAHIAVEPDLFARLEIDWNQAKLAECTKQLAKAKKLIQEEQDARIRRASFRVLLAHMSPKLTAAFFLITLGAIYTCGWWLPSGPRALLQDSARLFICAVILLWFPSVFVAPFNDSRIVIWVTYVMLFSVLLLPSVYGVLKGGIAIVLLGAPFVRLMNAPKDQLERNASETIQRQVFWATGLSLLLMGLVVTRENMWVIAGLIWLVFAALCVVSFQHFRFTFDMIDDMDPSATGAQTKRRLVYFALLSAAALLLSGVLGRLDKITLLEVYRQAGTISFGLVAVLFAVQSIAPSIASWGGAEKRERSPSQVREMKLLLKCNQGLVGFLQLFFAVFLVSLTGLAITMSAPPSGVPVDLSAQYLRASLPNITDWVNPWSGQQYSLQMLGVFAQTIVFTMLVCLFSYCIAVMYYMFVATNTLIMPIRDALMAQAVHIEASKDTLSNYDSLLDLLQESLRTVDRLRGEVIRNLSVSSDEEGRTLCVVIIDCDFDSAAEVMDKIIAVLNAVLRVEGVELARVTAVKASLGPRRHAELLSLPIAVTEQDLAFLNQKIDGMDQQYKLRQLGATMAVYLFPEAQMV